MIIHSWQFVGDNRQVGFRRAHRHLETEVALGERINSLTDDST
jgi:hypothetical protein